MLGVVPKGILLGVDGNGGNQASVWIAQDRHGVLVDTLCWPGVQFVRVIDLVWVDPWRLNMATKMEVLDPS